MQWQLDDEVTVFEAHMGSRKPIKGGQRLRGTVAAIDPHDGDGIKVHVAVPGHRERMTFDAETGQAWGDNYGWRLSLHDDESDTTAPGTGS